MGALSEDMKRVVREQRLAFVATVCEDGTPNVSPKGTIAVLDDDHLVFANVRSPRTVANLRRNPAVEINVVDPFVRKGYRFKGTAEVLDPGARFEAAMAPFANRGVASPIRQLVVIRVDEARPLVSPAYDLGATEAEIRERWEQHHLALKRGAEKPTGE